MHFREESQHLSELLRISAETILWIASVQGTDHDQLDRLAMEVDVLADRLMKIAGRRDRISYI